MVSAAIDLHKYRVSECVKLTHTEWESIYRAYPFEVKRWRQKPVREAFAKLSADMKFAE